MVGGYRTRRGRGELLRRTAVWGGLLFLLAVSESSFFSGLRFLPATPDLILCAVVTIALLDSATVAAVAAVGGGILSDALSGTGAYLSPLLYLLVVLAVGGMAEKMLGRIWSWLLLMLPALLLRGAGTLLGVILSYPAFSLGYVLKKVVLPEAMLSLLLGIPLYFIVLAGTRLCGERRGSGL